MYAFRGICILGLCLKRDLPTGGDGGSASKEGSASVVVCIQAGWADPSPLLPELGKQVVRILLECFLVGKKPYAEEVR